MHNPMLVSQVAQSAWHAWMLCRALMADLRARQAPLSPPSASASDDAQALEEDEAVDMVE